MDKLNELTADALAALATEKRGAFDALIALDAPTVAQVEEASSLADDIEAIQGEIERRETEAQAAAEKFASLRTRFAKNEEPQEQEADAAEEEDDEPQAVESDEEQRAASEERRDDEQTTEGEQVVPGDEGTGDARMEPQGEIGARAKGVATLAAKTARPVAPQRDRGMVSITAAADVPEFAAGSALESVEALGTAIVNRMRGFAVPRGDGQSEDLRMFGVASIRRPFSEDLTIDRKSDDMEVLAHAASEGRLDGGSLVAAGGWCAPSETLYDLAAPETTEGLLSVAEVNVKRGGINYTFGPDFADFFTNPDGMFVQTEAQAIAGATKPCVTVDCPPFQEVRLDAVGLCIKIPILTNAAYPELIQRYVRGFQTAYQHRISAEVLRRMLALADTTRTMTGLGSSVDDTLEGLTLVADQERQKRRLSMNQSLEVLLPFWTKNMFKADLRRRTGQTNPVTDQQITAHFAAANLNVQFLYNWQDLPLVDDAGTAGVNEANTYPASFQAFMYPAGTFVKGTSDVINLSAVYDAASLAENVYTGLFQEEGLLVAKMGYDSNLVTIPTCNAGRRGAQDITC